MARQLASQGHTVFGAETSRFSLCTFSNALSKSFAVPPPRLHAQAFCDALIQICKDEQIDWVLPMSEEVLYISEKKEAFPCPVFCPPFELLHTLHHKGNFQMLVAQVGLTPLPSKILKTKEDLASLDIEEDHILKPCYSRASQGIYKIRTKETPPSISISPNNPYLAQKWIHGKKYCIYAIGQQGKLAAFSCYPVEIAIGGSSCLSFRSIKHQKIEAWSKTFIEKTNYTGQISFDFVEEVNGNLYAIECNPRATSGLHLFSEKGEVIQALFDPPNATIYPKKERKSQILIGILLYGWLSPFARKHPLRFLKMLFTYGDVIFHHKDLKPLIFQPLLLFFQLYTAVKLRLSLIQAFTYDIDWEGNSGGT